MKNLVLILALACAAGCVNADPETGQTIPRGDQRYMFSEVKMRAEDLEIGMSKLDALLLLGSPAEMLDRRTVWHYLPERAALVVPSKSLRLKFKGDRLEEFGYHAIVLGAQL